MNISKIIRRNFVVEVSGKHAEKAVDVKLKGIGGGDYYTFLCSVKTSGDDSEFVKGNTKQLVISGVKCNDEVSIGEFLTEILYQFNKFVKEEQCDFDITRLITAFGKVNFVSSSESFDAVCTDMEPVNVEYLGTEYNDEYFEKAEVDGNMCCFVYQPASMGFKGIGKLDSVEIEYTLI